MHAVLLETSKSRRFLLGSPVCVATLLTADARKLGRHMSKLLLIDGSNYLFRAFHALPPLATSRGEPSGAIKGFHSMLGNVTRIVKPDAIACVFDAPGKTFRHEMYPEYKANRPPMPEDLRSQIEPVKELVRLMGIPLIIVPGVEADDVLATLARRAAAAGMDTVIATGDKDLAQIVDEHVTLINTMTRQILDRAGVFEKYGVYPERIIDYLALMGDKVDNVPGINKCGPKTAAKWIAEYGSLDGVIEHAQEVTGKIGEYLREGLPGLAVSRALVTINSDAPVAERPQELMQQKAQEDKLTEFFLRWEMSAGRKAAVKKQAARPEVLPSAQGELFALMPQEAAQPVMQPAAGGDFDAAVSDGELAALAELLGKASSQRLPVAVEVFADREHFMRDRAAGIGFCASPLAAVYVPLGHADAANASAESVARILGPWFAGDAPKVMHDAKWAGHVLANTGIRLGGTVHDTMLMSYVLEAHLKHDFERLAARYLCAAVASEEEFLGKGAARKKASEMAFDAVRTHVCQRARALRALSSVLLVRLSAEPGLKEIYETLELPVESVLWQMERTGVLIDAARLGEQSRELGEAAEAIEKQVHEIAGTEFNLASPRQLSDILFNRMGIAPKGKKLASGAYSTGEEVLSELALDYPIAKLILEYRALTKLKSTYTDKLPLMMDPQDGRVHTTFGQATAVTGRLASSEPNLQNIPVRTEEGRRVREAFVAPAGMKIISADYSQIELRVMAHISGDEGLLRAFREGRDVHRATASEVFGVDIDQVSAQQRRMAKVINFGLIYGMSAWGLRQNLGVEKGVAEHYIEQYFARYPKVKRYMEDIRSQARTHGYVQTAFGRRLWLPDIASSRIPVQKAAERAAINAPMQGTAADLIKKAMVAVQRWLLETGAKSRLILQVHDELILEVPEGEVEQVREALPRLMSEVAELKVPLVAEVGVADNWEAAH